MLSFNNHHTNDYNRFQIFPLLANVHKWQSSPASSSVPENGTYCRFVREDNNTFDGNKTYGNKTDLKT